jgi:hypothetical protein
MNSRVLLIYSLFIFSTSTIAVPFSPTPSDYDAYGIKIAANNLMIVEAQNDYNQFQIQFSPFTDNLKQTNQLSCSINYDSTSLFVYTVALGRNQTSFYFYFVGEVISTDDMDDLVANRTFIGLLKYTGNSTINCQHFEYQIQYITTSYIHQEHLVLTTDSNGAVAYGYSSQFTFTYTAKTNTLTVSPNNVTSFYPCAVDFDDNYGIIAGFFDNGQDSPIGFTPIVYLFDTVNSNLASWTYPTEQTNDGADFYTPQYDMSVSLNPVTAQVLIGIQSMNTVFLISYANQNLTLIAMQNNGPKFIGFGKGVAWLDENNSVAILVNVYTSTTYTWVSSQIYLYQTFTNTSSPISVLPNVQQSFFYNMSPIFLNIISNPSNFLSIIDSGGNIFVILSTPAGFYPSTTGSIKDGSTVFSSQTVCIPGTYKMTTGIQSCSPCPAGTKNGGHDITSCVPCANNTFCNLGATNDLPSSILSNVIQATPYPTSPENTIFDDILIQNMFTIGRTFHCIIISPIFWAIIVASIAFIIMFCMILLKFYRTYPKASERYKMLTRIFKQIDLIAEGEWWIGGLLSFCIVVLLIFAYVFSGKYYRLYPIEDTSLTANFACDLSIRNAKFSTTLQSLAVPLASGELQTMFDLLNNQEVYLNVDFLNTVFNCSEEIIIDYQLGTKWKTLEIVSCNYASYILSMSVLLPYKVMTVRCTLPNIYTIGGFRMGLSGSGETDGEAELTLKQLGFSQTFSQAGMMLGQTVSLGLKTTKVINQTLPLAGDDFEAFDGLWIGSFTINYYNSFVSETDYMLSASTPLTATTLIMTISETDHYILNVQEPIAKLDEIIFHNLLFTIVVLEIFGMIFLIHKLMIVPLISFIFVAKCKRHRSKPSRRNSMPAYDSEIRNSYELRDSSIIGIPNREHEPEIQLVQFRAVQEFGTDNITFRR